MSRPRIWLLCLLWPFWALADSAAGAGDKVSLQLNWKFQFEFAAPIAALEKGFYREAGLDVTLIEGGPTIDPVAPVAAGPVPFWMAGSTLVVNRAQGQPVVALAALMQHSAVGLLAAKRAGIQSVHDLAGKRLAISRDTADEIHAYLTSQGLPAPRFTQIAAHMDLADLQAGNADAISIYVSNELFSAQARIDDFVLLTPRSAGVERSNP